jgi:hypothetical protein
MTGLVYILNTSTSDYMFFLWQKNKREIINLYVTYLQQTLDETGTILCEIPFSLSTRE